MNEVETLRHFDEYQGIICIIINDDSTIVFGNARFNSLFKNAIGKDIVKLIHPDSIEEWISLIQKSKKTPNTLQAGSILALCTGHVYERISFELYFRDGKFGLVGYKTPVIGGSCKNTPDYKETLREIAYIQNHEFRPPVARILGISGLAIESNDIGELKNYALLMRKDAEQLDVFIKTITTLTKTND
jgi:hypothetical protein